MDNTQLITEWVNSLNASRYDYIEVEKELKINRSRKEFKNTEMNLSQTLGLLLEHREDNIRECVLGDLEIHGVNDKKQYYTITLHPVLKRVSNAVSTALENSMERYPIKAPNLKILK